MRLSHLIKLFSSRIWQGPQGTQFAILPSKKEKTSMQVFLKPQALQRLSSPRTLSAIPTGLRRSITTTPALQKHYASLDALLPKALKPSITKTTFTPANMGNNHLDASSSPLVWIDCEVPYPSHLSLLNQSP